MLRFLALASGVLVHICIFRHGEWDTKSPAIVLTYLVITLAGTLWFSVSSIANNGISDILSTDFLCLIRYHLLGMYSSIILYRGFFHRLSLSGYPGPFLARFSNFYLTWLSAKALHLHDEIDMLHAKYGDYVRTGIALSQKETNGSLTPCAFLRRPRTFNHWSSSCGCHLWESNEDLERTVVYLIGSTNKSFLHKRQEWACSSPQSVGPRIQHERYFLLFLTSWILLTTELSPPHLWTDSLQIDRTTPPNHRRKVRWTIQHHRMDRLLRLRSNGQFNLWKAVQHADGAKRGLPLECHPQRHEADWVPVTFALAFLPVYENAFAEPKSQKFLEVDWKWIRREDISKRPSNSQEIENAN